MFNIDLRPLVWLAVVGLFSLFFGGAAALTWAIKHLSVTIQ